MWNCPGHCQMAMSRGKLNKPKLWNERTTSSSRSSATVSASGREFSFQECCERLIQQHIQSKQQRSLWNMPRLPLASDVVCHDINHKTGEADARCNPAVIQAEKWHSSATRNRHKIEVEIAAAALAITTTILGGNLETWRRPMSISTANLKIQIQWFDPRFHNGLAVDVVFTVIVVAMVVEVGVVLTAVRKLICRSIFSEVEVVQKVGGAGSNYNGNGRNPCHNGLTLIRRYLDGYHL